ncbi:MAG TPA: 23S rRNA methyltransferase [Micromonosporaceae bacterium]|nr:23S rRNA methyltransferase [Micromonosporaceae bacterium]
MKPEVLPYLRCPICGQQVESGTAQPGAGDFLAHRPASRAARVLRCPRGHVFDIARQGYVNLSAGRAPQTGDSAEMVAAREEFLAAGHYDFVSTAVRADVVRQAARIGAAVPDRPGPAPMLLVDAGAGTGRHLAVALDALPAAVGLALDASKPALRRAARVHPRASAVLCDTWRTLPLADRSAALLLNIFAPRNGPEFHRVLRPDGALLVVTPAADHLQELVERFSLLRVDPAKTDRVAESLGDRFRPTSQSLHERRLMLSRRDVRTLIAMGPSAWHTDPVRLGEQIAVLPEPVTVTASIRLAVYRPA